MRFSAIEVPGTITDVKLPRTGLRSALSLRRGDQADPGAAPAAPSALSGPSGPSGPAPDDTARKRGGSALLAGEGLLVLGVVLGLAGLFPDYAGGQSLLSQSDQVVPHLCYVIGWAASAGLIALSVSRPRTARLGALFALGLSAVTFGLFLSDVGEVTTGAKLGSGLVVSLLGWLACTVGAALALVVSGRDTDPRPAGVPVRSAAGPGWPVRPTRGHAGPLALLVLAGIGTAAAFAPAWDSYTVTQASTGIPQTYLEGNAFSNPAVMIAGSVAVMVAVVAVAALAALWQPAKQGAWLLAGAIVPLVTQAISALIQIGQSPYSLFGLTQAQAKTEGVTIASGMTPIFWVYVVFVVALIVSFAWLLTAPGQSAVPAVPWSPWMPPATADGGLPPNGPATAEEPDDEPDDEPGQAYDRAAVDDDAIGRDMARGDGGAGAGDGGHSAYA
jgi:hypothetical protein